MDFNEMLYGALDTVDDWVNPAVLPSFLDRAASMGGGCPVPPENRPRFREVQSKRRGGDIHPDLARKCCPARPSRCANESLRRQAERRGDDRPESVGATRQATDLRFFDICRLFHCLWPLRTQEYIPVPYQNSEDRG